MPSFFNLSLFRLKSMELKPGHNPYAHYSSLWPLRHSSRWSWSLGTLGSVQCLRRSTNAIISKTGATATTAAVAAVITVAAVSMAHSLPCQRHASPTYNSEGGMIRPNGTIAASLCRTGSGGPLCSIWYDTTKRARWSDRHATHRTVTSADAPPPPSPPPHPHPSQAFLP